MKEVFLKEGYVELENVLSDELFEKLKTLSSFYIDRVLKRQNYTGNVCYNLFRTENILSDFPLPELISNDYIYNLLAEILGADFILKEILIYFSLPNNNYQELHSDVNPLFPEKLDITTPTYLVAVQFPLIDFNFNSGATRIIPKTHNSISEPTRIENEDINNIKSITPAIKMKGCLIRDCRAWHGSGINKSKDIRAMITLAFARSWYGKKGKVSKDVFFCIDKNKRHLVDF